MCLIVIVVIFFSREESCLMCVVCVFMCKCVMYICMCDRLLCACVYVWECVCVFVCVQLLRSLCVSPVEDTRVNEHNEGEAVKLACLSYVNMRSLRAGKRCVTTLCNIPVCNTFYLSTSGTPLYNKGVLYNQMIKIYSINANVN